MQREHHRPFTHRRTVRNQTKSFDVNEQTTVTDRYAHFSNLLPITPTWFRTLRQWPSRSTLGSRSRDRGGRRERRAVVAELDRARATRRTPRVTGRFPADHPFRHITAVPGLGHLPAIWLLGSGTFSAQLAGMLGLPFSFAHHFAPENTMAAIDAYRSAFRPSDHLAEAFVMLGASVIVAEDEARADGSPVRAL